MNDAYENKQKHKAALFSFPPLICTVVGIPLCPVLFDFLA